MKAVIPAAGVGTRLRPHTYTLPKALLYVAGKPIISHILDEVRELDVSGVVLIVGYKGELIEEYVSQAYRDLKIDFVYQRERLGIGHAVHMTRAVADVGEPLLIILGDTILKTDLTQVAGNTVNVLGVKEVEDPRRFGVCELRNGKIVRLVEKPKDPPGNLAVVGLYHIVDSSLLFEVLQQQQDQNIRNHGEYQITDALQMMIDRGAEFAPFEIGEWFDCGKPEALLETNRQLLMGKDDIPQTEGSIILPPVSIDPSATIKNSIIGPYVSIASNSVVENSIVRDSVLDQGSTVSNCLLKSSIIGSQAVIRGGFQNLNIGDSSEVIFK
ncbi:MAG: NTP transferase domain-containing protein [Candidatus Latescibacterota bacterium]|nr:MAG: NTP transferase domain-containing protein [Candidatus Latescibacterota bacterium]